MKKKIYLVCSSRTDTVYYYCLTRKLAIQYRDHLINDLGLDKSLITLREELLFDIFIFKP